MDHRLTLGTDTALFYCYDPTVLRHRQQDARAWYFDGTPPEQTDGRMGRFQAWKVWGTWRVDPTTLWDERPYIGSDGDYAMRCTTEGLTPEEQRAENPSLRDHFLLQVTHGRVLLDGGYAIPCATEPGEPRHTFQALQHLHLVAWLEVPNGTYDVTVHYLASSDGGTGSGVLPEIVLVFHLHAYDASSTSVVATAGVLSRRVLTLQPC